MDISEFNPWWETGSFKAEERRRDLFYKLKDRLHEKFIEAVVGPRRVGKTTIFYQLIEELLEKGVTPSEIFYFSFDLEKGKFSTVLGEYEEKILRDRIKNRKIYLFFDEVQKVEDWANAVKVLYDLNPKAKVFISGSASLHILSKGMESLAGRARFSRLLPLKFSEFLRLKGITVTEPLEAQGRRIQLLIGDFLPRAFPETLEMKEDAARTYTRELVVDRIIYRDISEIFKVKDVELLHTLAQYIFNSPGAVINANSLSKDLGRDRRTLTNALVLLESSFLVRTLRNLRGSHLAASRKNKKAYPVSPSLCLTKDEGFLMETLIASELEAEFYWRRGRQEVDFILKGEGIQPVEAKYRNQLKKEDASGIIEFCDMRKLKRGLIITKQTEEIQKINGLELKMVPLWKWLLTKKTDSTTQNV